MSVDEIPAFLILCGGIQASVAQPAEHSAWDRRARVQGLSGEIPPCALMTPVASKIRRGWNVLQDPI